MQSAVMSELLSLSETARRHGVSKSGLHTAVEEDRPIKDLNLYRYAVETERGVKFDFPTWYTFPEDGDSPTPKERTNQSESEETSSSGVGRLGQVCFAIGGVLLFRALTE